MKKGHQASQRNGIHPTMPELEIPGLQILNEIGQGGMAKVYLAMQESLQRPVAVKLLNNPDTPGFHERFMNEGRYLAALSHSNIVEVYDVGECSGHYYILMEYLPGSDLKRRIQKGMKPATALKLMVRIANCLDYLHDQGIIHRDLKPSNILFRADSNPVLTDFGIAKLLQDVGELTMGGSILGSPSYLSPEQAGFSAEIDGRSDLYSLGVIFYEVLTGQRPFNGKNFAAIIMAHLQDPIPKLPERLIRYQPIIERLLAKRADERFQTGAELIQAIRSGPIAEIHQLRRRSDLEVSPDSEQLDVVEENLAQSTSFSQVKRIIWSIVLLLATGLLPEFSPNQGESVSSAGITVLRDYSSSMAGLLATEKPAPSARQSSDKVRPVARRAKARSDQLQPVKPKLNRIDHLFSLAYKRMDSLRLSYPKGDSALKYFRDILKLEPENKAAKAGIRQIVRWYIQKAETALDENNSEQAKRYIHRARLINGQHPKLLVLQERIGVKKKPVEEVVYEPFNILDY